MTENVAAKQTYVVMRPPPGTRFSIWGSDVRLDFQKGREREIIEWLRNWIDSYIEPLVVRAEKNNPVVQPKPAVVSKELQEQALKTLRENFNIEADKLFLRDTGILKDVPEETAKEETPKQVITKNAINMEEWIKAGKPNATTTVEIEVSDENGE